jgi:hypothetical protein
MITIDVARQSSRRDDTVVWNNTADAIDSGGPERIARDSASTYAFCLFASVEVFSFPNSPFFFTSSIK